MGEMADYYLEMMDQDDLELDCESRLYSEVRCKYCKRGGFHWHYDDQKGWRLHTNSGRIHKCKAYKPAPETPKPTSDFLPPPAGWKCRE